MTPHELPVLPLLLWDAPPALRLVLAQEGVPFLDVKSDRASWPATADPAVRALNPLHQAAFVVFDSMRQPAVQLRRFLLPCQRAIDVDAFRTCCERLPQGVGGTDPFDALVDTRATVMGLEIGGHVVRERIARYPKAELRRSLARWLQDQLEQCGGAWIRLAYYPHPYRTAFNFRVDHDEYDADDFAAFTAAIRGHEGCFSHFVCVGSHERHAEALRRLADWDTGSHGYHHYTYRDRLHNRINIERAFAVLAGHGMTRRSFVAPFGTWNPALAEVLEEMSVEYSSEFALAYDDVPFDPYLPRAGAAAGRYSTVVQIPIHPVCLGIFLEAGVQDLDTIGRYFQGVIRAKYDRGDPIFLYGHPTGRLGRYPGLLKTILCEIDGLDGVWKTTLSDFAAWWRQRGQAKFSVFAHHNGYRLQFAEDAAEAGLAIEVWRGGKVARLPVHGTTLSIPEASLTYESASHTQPLASSQPCPSVGPFKRTVKNYLDWERITPVSDLRVRSVGTLVKKALRRLGA